jgi:hypothetical protein
MASEIPVDLTTVAPLRAEITHWRETRTYRGAPMPHSLWAAAVEVARRYGLAPTARALRIDYGSLKRRLTATGPSRELETPSFVDLGSAVRLGLGPSVITVDATDGRRLRVELVDVAGVDLCALVRAVWGPAV